MSIWTDLWNLFFPHSCLLCGRQLISGERVLCLKCLSGLPRTQFHLRKDNIVECNFWGKIPVEHATSFLYYAKGGNVALILYAMKYHGRKKLCRNMGRLMAGELLASGFFEGIDYLLPVPLYRSRLRQRGYNQSELLARGISEVTGVSLCTDAIVRSRNNATQTHKSGYARWKNVEGLFQPTVNAPKLEGKHILLVDDVLTTGATLIACADALSELKSIRISVLTLAWAR